MVLYLGKIPIISMYVIIIGASAASPTLVVKMENCLYVCRYVWYVRIPYIYILPHLCAMQYFYIVC